MKWTFAALSAYEYDAGGKIMDFDRRPRFDSASLFHGCYSILLLLSLEQTVKVDIECNFVCLLRS